MAAPKDPVKAAAPRGAGDVVVRAVPVDTLTGALGLGGRELVALVGGGGKTAALQLMAEELGAEGGRVGVTTTTAMFLRDMAVVGPVVMGTDTLVVADRVRAALAQGHVVAFAKAEGAGGKVAGLSPGAVDELWATGLADHLIVEADGSRGRALKAFAAHEPQVPAATTTVVLAAGLDAVGAPLDDEHVHRAEALSALLALAGGAEVTEGVFADALRAQLRQVRRSWGSSRIVVLLNKADGAEEQARGIAVALELLTGRAEEHGRPDSAVVASLRERRFAAVSIVGGRA
jgi:probable selenium-dependent hydroxylase accessory protein YqeC